MVRRTAETMHPARNHTQHPRLSERQENGQMERGRGSDGASFKAGRAGDVFHGHRRKTHSWRQSTGNCKESKRPAREREKESKVRQYDASVSPSSSYSCYPRNTTDGHGPGCCRAGEGRSSHGPENRQARRTPKKRAAKTKTTDELAHKGRRDDVGPLVRGGNALPSAKRRRCSGAVRPSPAG